MNQVLFWLAVATAAFYAALTAELGRRVPRLPRLGEVRPLADAELPSASIVVAARNEARGIEGGLRSLLRLDYPRLEIIAVDDRSDDGTGEIMDRIAGEDPRLTIVHVATLPPGWLGKNHALHLGAGQASGDLLLFTDGDVVLAPDTLRLATSYLVREKLDHVAAGLHVDMPGWMLQTFGVFFGLAFTIFTRPWKVRDPRSRRHIGIGAFNLIRADTYRRIGGHQPIALRPDDDIKLGKLLKKCGGTQDFLNAADRVRVEWYHSVREAVHGLRKNAFAGIDYRISVVLLSTVALLLSFVWPFLALLVTHGWTRAANAVTVALILALFAGAAREQKVRPWLGVAVPLAALMFIVVMWNAMLYALIHRGIEWRGTHYALDELRANKV